MSEVALVGTMMDVSRLTGFQESVLHTMMLYERTKRLADNRVGECVFTSKFFEELLGVKWQGYHNTMMDQLASYRWITITQPSNRARFYRLTLVGRQNLLEHYLNASPYVWYS